MRWIFLDTKSQEFSTTKFASVMGTLSSVLVVVWATVKGMDSALLTQLLIYLGGLVGGTAVIRRVVGKGQNDTVSG
jgi:hypothetical protein